MFEGTLQKTAVKVVSAQFHHDANINQKSLKGKKEKIEIKLHIDHI